MAAGIYIHIPFCVRKCLYCDFVSRTGSKEDMQRYHRALINEIELTVVKETVDSIFFGGGTPSVYPVEYIEEIIDKLKCRCDVRENSEITIECNPGTLNMDKLYRYRQAGINRISIGLQSCNNEELKKLGRIHTYEEFEHSFIMARDAGFNNINIDIMSAIPDQTIASYKETLHKVVSLRPQHISAYSLIIEEGTPFFSEYGKGSKNENKLPDEDTDREMYHLTKAYLKENGYERYEISNYARSEKECKHNIKYWNRDNYYGFGVSAASLVDNVRYTNISDIINYVENEGKPQYIRESEDIINKQEQMEEYMILGLRKMKGICIKDFNRIFDTKIENIYGETLEKMCNNGLMECDSGYYRLTEYGIDVSNIVLAEFL